jgi:hypothetical protein
MLALTRQHGRYGNKTVQATSKINAGLGYQL